MKIELTPEQLKLQEQFQKFVDKEVAPMAEQNDREERVPEDLIKKIADQGYLGSMLPVEYGGKGWDMITIGLLNEEFGRGCSSARSLLTVHGMAALGIERWGTPEQRNYWLPKMASGEIIGAFALTEPNVGSDAKSVETTAVLEDDYFILNGQKKWITMGQIANIFLLFAKCEGKPTAFIVEKCSPGFSFKPINGLIGARASMLAELKLENCRIPKGNLVGSVGTGLSHVALSCLNYGRYTIAFGCVGLGQACLKKSVQYTRKRRQFGAPLRENQLIQKMITEMVVNIKAARQLCYHAGYLKDTGDPDYIMATWIAKYFASKMINQVAGDAVQIHGANGFSREYDVERYFRDSKINEVIEGTTQMHEILIAMNAFRNI
ncbi:acyl-CoA dehydrogenase family protein [Ruminiclostridium cellobioparum]|uniref:Acyl-CoA dehydrogenase n=1 Tax=Ruminiclostridium cellobioparum subsp. termitidis CT1112 TaxID=1195236 RepID=S0FTK8_RUMCE|nr:acyl-CoA dehydrogenase family protein [Ruminiclostridium cellobioparum]EMS72509.1 acyl-CoA dehydrogenase [Ruminiclostridium cellobioparum subsp. termitidis CT1112]